MRIVIIQGAFLPVPPVAGGAVERLWYQLGIYFAQKGCKVTHVSRRYKMQPESELDSSGVRRIRLSGFDYPRSTTLAKFFDFIYSCRVMFSLPEADIYITNTLFLPMLPFWGRKGKVYVSVHRFPRNQYSYYWRAHRLQCVSSAVAEKLVVQTPKQSNITKVIANFVPKVANLDVAVESKLRYSSKTILYVGRIHQEKGLEGLIRAFIALSDGPLNGWCLRIIGPHAYSAGGGGENYLDFLKKISNGSSVKIEWVGPIYDYEDLSSEYRKASWFCYPSIAVEGEAFGLAPLEAMSHGVPCLLSNLKCFDDFILHGKNGCVYEDFMGLQECLKFIALCKFDEYAAMSFNAINTALRFNLSAVGDDFISDFNELLES